MYKIERNGYYVGEVDKDGYGHVDGVTGRFTTSGEPIHGEKYVDSEGHNCVVDVWGDIVEDPYERGQRIEQELYDVVHRNSENWGVPSDDPIEKLLTLPFKGLFKLGRLIVTSPFKGVKRKIAQDRLAKEQLEYQRMLDAQAKERERKYQENVAYFKSQIKPKPAPRVVEQLPLYEAQDLTSNTLLMNARKLESEGKVKEAFDLAQKGIKEENAEVINLLGTYYAKGIGCEKNQKAAFKLYELAAEYGSGFACNNLGHIYYNGVGTNKDPLLAFYYFKEGVKHNNLFAFTGLGLCYYHGVGTNQDYKKAFHYYNQAAQAGEPRAQNNLGLCYYNGFGCEVNKRLAYFYLKLAAENGLEAGMNNIKNLDLEKYKT